MKSFLLTFLLLLLSFSKGEGAEGLVWLDSYEELVQKSKEEGVYGVLYFTGSDWCKWCKKLEKKVLTDPSFVGAVKDKLVFLELDFPQNKEMKDRKKNLALKERYQVLSFPSLLIIDSNERALASFGYRKGEASSYADSLLLTISNYDTLVNRMERSDLAAYDEKLLRELYAKAQEFSREDYLKLILEKALEKEASVFFLLEKYYSLSKEKGLNVPEVKALRESLLALDPKNQHEVHYRLAVVDFQAKLPLLASLKDPFSVLEPLFTYLDTFGDSDQENAWRLRMTIAQIFFSKGMKEDALRFAESSFQTAPEPAKDEISEAIRYFSEEDEYLN